MFWIISAILILIALAFVLPSLWGKNKELDVTREQNIAIAQEQLADLESRFEQGKVDQINYQATRDEIELSLYHDINATKESNSKDSMSNTTIVKKPLISTVLLILLIPVLSVAVYLKFGNLSFIHKFDSIQSAQQAREDLVPRNADGSPDIDTMVAKLQQKMDKNPDNPKGWYMLGRSYMVLKNYEEAAKSFDRAYKLTPESAEIMLSLADSLSMSNQGQLVGKPAELVAKALEVEPANITALWLSGMASRQQGDYQVAISQWQKVLPLIKDKPNDIVEVERLIAEAKRNLTPEQVENLSQNPKPKIANHKNTNSTYAGIMMKISLSEKLLNKVTPDDYVFIYAKAMNGPPMPLAAVRKQVKDLPLDILLNDEMAMMPNLKLSSFSEVIVGARVSKSGQPLVSEGDLFAEIPSVKEGDKKVLEIDKVFSK